MPGGMPYGGQGYYGPYKNRITYILLALFLGGAGIHSFYAGYTQRGVIQLVLGLLSSGIISGIWALIEVFTVTVDAYGRPMI